jgi:hypothetical protein
MALARAMTCGILHPRGDRAYLGAAEELLFQRERAARAQPARIFLLDADFDANAAEFVERHAGYLADRKPGEHDRHPHEHSLRVGCRQGQRLRAIENTTSIERIEQQADGDDRDQGQHCPDLYAKVSYARLLYRGAFHA